MKRDWTQLNVTALWAAFAAAKAIEPRGSDSPVKIIGIRRGEDAEGVPNSFAHYDDDLIVIIDGQATQWLASVDPTWFFVQSPLTPPQLTGQLCLGIHLFGKHNLHGDPGKPALMQAEDVHVNRLNTDGTVNHIEMGQFAVCIHSGGSGMDTGRFSLACQILENEDGYFGDPTWSRFIKPIYAGMDAHQLTTIPYLLCDLEDALPFI